MFSFFKNRLGYQPLPTDEPVAADIEMGIQPSNNKTAVKATKPHIKPTGHLADVISIQDIDALIDQLTVSHERLKKALYSKHAKFAVPFTIGCTLLGASAAFFVGFINKANSYNEAVDLSNDLPVQWLSTIIPGMIPGTNTSYTASCESQLGTRIDQSCPPHYRIPFCQNMAEEYCNLDMNLSGWGIADISSAIAGLIVGCVVSGVSCINKSKNHYVDTTPPSIVNVDQKIKDLLSLIERLEKLSLEKMLLQTKDDVKKILQQTENGIKNDLFNIEREELQKVKGLFNKLEGCRTKMPIFSEVEIEKIIYFLQVEEADKTKVLSFTQAEIEIATVFRKLKKFTGKDIPNERHELVRFLTDARNKLASQQRAFTRFVYDLANNSATNDTEMNFTTFYRSGGKDVTLFIANHLAKASLETKPVEAAPSASGSVPPSV